MGQQTSSDLAKRFASYYTPILDLLSRIPDQGLVWHDILDVKLLARYAFGRTLLLGDAAHATTPNMGQGACQAVKDAVVLADELRRHQLPQQAFVGFEARRLARTRYVTNTSWRLGQLAQTTNPVLVALRNGIFRGLLKGVTERQLETLFKVDF